MAPSTGDWSLPQQSLSEQVSMDLSTGASGRGIFAVEVPFSHMSLVCVGRKLTPPPHLSGGRKRSIKKHPKPPQQNQAIKYLNTKYTEWREI